MGFFADLIREGGEPALELGCGTGHPLLALVADGLEVEGLDASDDMLARCAAAARVRGLEVTLHRQEMQALTLPRRYRTIFLAGASFMLLPDLDDARHTLRRIHDHLAPGGRAVIPLYVPPLVESCAPERWTVREKVREEDGVTLRVAERFDHDAARQLRVATLRYEVVEDGQIVRSVERPWVLRWYTQAEFRGLVTEAGFVDQSFVREDCAAGSDDAYFTCIATRQP